MTISFLFQKYTKGFVTEKNAVHHGNSVNSHFTDRITSRVLPSIVVTATFCLKCKIMASDPSIDHFNLPTCSFDPYDLQFKTSQTPLSVTTESSKADALVKLMHTTISNDSRFVVLMCS